MPGLVGQRDVEAHDVGLAEERVEVVLPTGERRLRAERGREPGRLPADPAGADDEQALAREARARA